MMKWKTYGLMAAALLVATPASAAPTISVLNDLDFGGVAADKSSPGEAKVVSATVVTPSGGAIVLDEPLAATAQVQVSGLTALTNYDIDLNGDKLSEGGGNTVALKKFVIVSVSPGTASVVKVSEGLYRLEVGANTTVTLEIGATAEISANHADGEYSGNFDIEINESI